MNKKILHDLLENLVKGDMDAASANLSKRVRRIAIDVVNEERREPTPEDYTHENVNINGEIAGHNVVLVFDCVQSVVWDYVPATFNDPDESEISDYGDVTAIISKTFQIDGQLIFQGNELFEDMTPFSKKLNEALESVEYAINWAIENDDVKLNLSPEQIKELSKQIVIQVNDKINLIEEGRF